MIKRTTTSVWEGTLKEGKGEMQLQSGAYKGPFSFASRFESGEGTNPEELIAAAQSGCFSMFLSALISKKDITPTSIETTADVTLVTEDSGPRITTIELTCEAVVPGLDNESFQQLVTEAKENCPIAKLCSGADISVKATMIMTATAD